MKQLIFFFLLFFIFAKNAAGLYDPREVANNRFGIHIIDDNDLEDTKNLVNSSGGDWGYVTLVIREDDRNHEKWQNVFDRLRRSHLIPLVRLATRVERGGWIKPRVDDIGSWVDFLGSLNWVVENRYVIVFNEPNHAKEWGGDLNPEEYAWYLKEFSHRLKERSEDFFILPAGLDASAPNSTATLDELVYLKRMLTKEPDVFAAIDGWTSHSYPNPDFSGSPTAQGRGTVRTYLWELSQLNNFGLTKDLPVFITETGWKHRDGKILNRSYLTPEMVADHFRTAFATAWSDPQVIAVTPFLLNYQDAPFDQFSWRKMNSSEFHPVYETVSALPKTTGQPRQHTSVRFLEQNFPRRLVTNSVYSLYVEVENTGQSIIGGETWEFKVQGLPRGFQIATGEIKEIEPFQRTRIEVQLTTPAARGEYEYSFHLTKGRQTVITLPSRMELVAPPGLILKAKLWFRQLAEGEDYRLQIFDQERLLHDIRQIPFVSGRAEVENLYNIVPDQSYRLLLSKPFYLSREVEALISEGKTVVSFPTLLPLDPSNDGNLNLSDLVAFFRHPLQTLGLIFAL